MAWTQIERVVIVLQIDAESKQARYWSKHVAKWIKLSSSSINLFRCGVMPLPDGSLGQWNWFYSIRGLGGVFVVGLMCVQLCLGAVVEWTGGCNWVDRVIVISALLRNCFPC